MRLTPSRRELALFLAACAGCALLLRVEQRVRRDAGGALSTGETFPALRRDVPAPPFLLEAGRTLPEIRITADPASFEALDALLPEDAHCQKVGFPSFLAGSVLADGRPLPGPHRFRYRGFCAQHWRGRQKSLKLMGGRDAILLGHRTLNLSALATDRFLFEAWAGLLLSRSGGVASRTGLARLFINGRYNGPRLLNENLDADLLSSQGFPKGAIYREKTFAELGKTPASKEDLRNWWEKNSRRGEGWGDFERLNDSVHTAVAEGGAGFRGFVDVPHYVNYTAVATITGTMHLTDHNTPFYRPGASERFIPVGYDFSEDKQGAWSGLEPAAQVPYASMNWLSQLFWEDPALRLDIHRRIAFLLSSFPDIREWYDGILAAAEPEIGRALEEGLILDDPVLGIQDLASYRAKNDVRRKLAARLAFLRRSYLDPVVRVPPGWARRGRFQAAIEGAGVYRFELRSSGRRACRDGGDIRVRVHQGAWRPAFRLEKGRCRPVRIRAERNDIGRPTLKTRNHLTRNSIGAILIDVEAPPNALGDISVFSEQTGREVPVHMDWPFDIQLEGDTASLGTAGLPLLASLDGAGDGFAWIRGPGQRNFRYDADRHRLMLGGQEGAPLPWERFGPLLCWSLGSRRACHEFPAVLD